MDFIKISFSHIHHSAFLFEPTSAESNYVEWRSSSHDGNNVITNEFLTKLAGESTARGFSSNSNDIIKHQQARTNRISNSLGPGEPYSRFQQAIRALNGNFSPLFRTRGFVTRPRAVESPALSVDSGGRTSSSIAHEVAKILNVKQGHYSDIYDKIDGKSDITTKAPADALEDTIRIAVQRFLAKRFQQHESNPQRVQL